MFNIYETPEETLNTWSKQLISYTKGNFRQYDDVEDTIKEWEKLLNRTNLVNSNQVFRIYDTPEETLRRWKNQLNSLFIE